jgi:uncharacterized protein YbjT (DUF2867 family)
MNIILTGSLGHIGKPLTENLVQKGHAVTVISSKTDKQKAIEELGAKPAIGSIDDADFLTTVFKGADIVYLMLPPFNFFDQNIDMEAYWTNIAGNYVKAVLRSGVKRVIYLSSIGAHTDKGNGMLNIHYNAESIIRQLPADVSIKFMRPVGFYYNMFAFIATIKAHGAIFQNYGGDVKEPWVSHLDIAATVAEEVGKPFEGRTVRYIAGDEVSPDEVAKVLGKAIGKPDLKWQVISDEQFLNGLLAVGFSPRVAKGFVDMNAGRLNKLYDDYHQHRPTFGNVKLTDFAKDFAAVYNQQ